MWFAGHNGAATAEDGFAGRSRHAVSVINALRSS